jgi:hypothetical protein
MRSANATPRSQLPGLVLVMSGGEAAFATYAALADGVEVGRTSMAGLRDATLSRRHARVWHQQDRWCIHDLGSRNGTLVDGRPLHGAATGAFKVLRAGSSLFLLTHDLAPYESAPIATMGEAIVGGRLRAAYDTIAGHASEPSLHIGGESGVGKKLAARVYHRAGSRRAGPFVAVDCAGLSARALTQLIGGTVGAGTVLLAEVADLDRDAQRALAEILDGHAGTGAAAASGLGVCSTSKHDLAALVARGRFHEDLHQLLLARSVVVPPLCERLEEIPHLVAHTLAGSYPGIAPDVSFVEGCLLRSWPGNVRELVSEVREAALQLFHRLRGSPPGAPRRHTLGANALTCDRE